MRIISSLFLLLCRHSTCHGFIVIHGTDTLAHTAAALSFVFERQYFTIVVTGNFHQLSFGLHDISRFVTHRVQSAFRCDEQPYWSPSTCECSFRCSSTRIIATFGVTICESSWIALATRSMLHIPTVVYLHNLILMGTRFCKVHSSNYRSFITPKVGPLEYHDGAFHTNYFLLDSIFGRC